jgi:hypothetical protein
MRAIFTLLVSFSLINLISAQENGDVVYDQDNDNIRTLFGNERITNGGYGAFTFGYSEINNLSAVSIGGRGAWIIGHWFAIGVGGTGFINDINYNNAQGQYTNITGGYGGLILEPIILPWIPVHISLPVLFGAGGIANVISEGTGDVYEPPSYVEDATSFFIIEPGAELELNLIKHFRLAAGVSYRLTNEILLYNVPEAYPLDGWIVNVTLKFGKF